MSSRARAALAGVAALLVAGSGVSAVARTVPEPVPELPVFHGETARGSLVLTGSHGSEPVAKTVDGAIGDWVGTGSGLGGTTVRSAGELIYSDYLFDAFGADDGGDAQRLALIDPLNDAVGETYRLDPIFQLDLAGELGIDTPEDSPTKAEEQYGDGGDRSIDAADLLELRLAADGGNLYVLARTTTMQAAGDTAVVLLFDTVPASPPHPVPFGTGLTTAAADVAVLLADGAGRAVDLTTGVTTPVPVAVGAGGWDNAVEAAVPLTALGVPLASVRVAAGTGLFDPAAGGLADLPSVAANVANVAFRSSEPVRTWMDKQQALALEGGSIDPFFAPLDLDALRSGTTDEWHPGPGYYERVFTSSPAISSETGQDGIHQHYGVYLSPAYRPGVPAPTTFWLHWRGGKAHSAAAVSPRIMRDFGDGMGGIVVAPRGRGSSTWYLGRGQVDVDEVWADARGTFTVDEDRVYLSGHSMGGFGTYLLSLLHPDRYAAVLPVAGPVTQGMWTGLDFPGCDDYTYDDYSFCYVQTNDSNARVQHTRRLLANLRNVPIGIYQGGADELVWVSGVTRQVEELANLGYRYRYYLFPNYEHYSHPVVDEWAEGVRYLSQFTRVADPARVTYVRDMPFEQSVESGANQRDERVEAQFDFDHAYWMSELTPVDALAGVARFDGRTLAIADPATVTVPEAGGPSSVGQAGPYAMTGLAWLADPLAPAPVVSNGFEITLSGARAVRLDLLRMGIDPSRPYTATVTTDVPLELRLDAGSAGVRVVSVPAGTSTLTL